MAPAVKAYVPHEMVPVDVKEDAVCAPDTSVDRVAATAIKLPVDVRDPTVTAPAVKLFVPTDKAP
jgi:hypothetical protein